jgi:RNA polymerase sigma-70 factor (ECF subfamily)
MVDHFRRQRQPGESLGEEHELPATPDEAGGPGSASEFEDLAGCLAPMIESLPPADREAIDLSEIKGLRQRAASTRAGVTLSGMKSRVQRARRKLKAMLRDCCLIELDRRGGIVGHEPRDRACDCGPAGTEGKQPKWK